MAGPIRISILADSRGAVAGINRVSGSTDSFGRKMQKVSRTVAAGFALITVAAVKFGTDSVKAASDAEQSLGATEAIYGKHANRVVALSNKAAKAVGLSSNAYRENSNLLGALFKNQGVSLDKLSAKTDKHVTLAADLSAMYGGPVTDAVDAVTAAYKGEFNQLEKYGVTIKQSIINTEADVVAKKQYGKALKDLGPKQQSLAKQLATQNILFRQTGDATGAFARESDTLAGKQQRLAARMENVKAKVGKALLPILIDLAAFADTSLVPVLERFSVHLNKNSDAIRATAQEWGGRFLSAVRGAWDVLRPLLETINKIPGPMKEMALQAGLLGVAMKKIGAFSLISSMATLGTTSATTAGQTDKAAKSVGRFGVAARQAAGLGGILGVTQGMKQSNKAAGALMSTLGGAAIGFSVGGPVGAAVGGLGGLFLTLFRNTGKAESAAKVSTTTWETYAQTMDTVTGSLTNATKAMLIQDLQKSGTLSLAKNLGISQQTLVDGIFSEGKARDTLAASITAQKAKIEELRASPYFFEQSARGKGIQQEVNDRKALIKTITNETGELKKSSDVKRQEIALLNGIPERVVTRIQTPGAVDSVREIALLTRRMGLTPKQVKSVISLSGVDTSVKQVRNFIKGLDPLPAAAKKQGAATGKGLNDGTGAAVKANLKAWQGPYKEAIAGGGGAKPDALTGGGSVGRNLASGTASGIYVGLPWVVAAARSMARTAKVAAENELGIKSPSRVFKKIGQQTVQGYILGVQSGADGVRSTLSKITGLITKSITGKNQKKRESAVLRSLKDEYAALVANGKAQDRINSKLVKAKERLAEVKEWADRVTESFVASGNVTLFGKQEDGTVSGSLMLSQLRDAVARAQRFAALIRDLTAQGLNKTSLDQLLAAGPEAAIASAEALAAGGSAAITEVNTLTSELAKAGASLGSTMSDQFFAVGLRAAEGIVAGLVKDQKALDRAATKMAEALIKKVKKALGIKSPSREFRDIGGQVVKGLGIGLDNTYVKRQGASLAGSLKDGFGAPALAAVLDARASGSKSSVTVTLTAEQIDQLQRGKAIRADLDAWDGLGSRRAS